MKMVRTFAVLALVTVALTAAGVSQQPPKVTLPVNLVRGVTGPVVASPSWSGFSAINEIPGGSVIPITTTTTAFYLGFAAGQTADVSNMVLYTTNRNSPVITAVTPVTLGGVSNPSINLTSTSVCPGQPLSANNPCIVRLDPATLTLSAMSDYYLVVYFKASDSNNSAINATEANRVSGLFGWYIGSDQTQQKVGQSIPAGNSGNGPYFLMYVMNN